MGRHMTVAYVTRVRFSAERFHFLLIFLRYYSILYAITHVCHQIRIFSYATQFIVTKVNNKRRTERNLFNESQVSKQGKE